MTERPTVSKMRWARSICSGLTKRPRQRPATPAPSAEGRVGHGADDGDLYARGFFDGAGLHGRREGDDGLARREGRLDFGDEVGDLEGLDANEDEVSLARGGDVVRTDVDTPLRGAGEGFLSVGNGGVDVFGSEEVLLEEGLEQDAAHFAGAEDGDVEVGDLRGSLRGLNGYLSHVLPYKTRLGASSE